MREIELVTRAEVPKRVDGIKRSLEDIYGVELSVEIEEVPLSQLYPTEDFLEKDKLALVFMKVMTEGYNVPIIAVKNGDSYFILDGHHRSFISRKLNAKTMGTNVLKFPSGKSYRALPKRLLDSLPIRDVAYIDDPILRAWGQILTLLKYYEALHDVAFSLLKEDVPLKDLVPTQPQISRRQIDSIRELLVPIVTIKWRNTFYILDGHARSLRAKQLKLKTIEAMILLPEVEIEYGIVRTAREMNLKSLRDIKIVE